MLIETRPATDPELTALVIAQQRELREADGGRDGRVFVVRDGARYLIAALDGRAVACGAWQPLAPGVAELKRMYVRPAYRGRGIARQLAVSLEEDALAAGHPTLRLETGTYLPAAISLCRSLGYTEIPVFGDYVHNPFSVCFEKRLQISA